MSDTDLKVGGFYTFNSSVKRCIYKFHEDETMDVLGVLYPYDHIVLLAVRPNPYYSFKVLTTNGIVGWVNSSPEVFVNAIISK